MSCTSPLVRCETFNRYKNQKGGWSYKAEWGDRTLYDEGIYESLVKNGIYRRVDLVGCGKCLECRQKNAREWATRMMLELKDHDKEKCHFLTFTYNDDHIFWNQTVNTNTGEIMLGASLRKKDMQDCWKRIRKKNPKLKYVMSGEYGKQTNRPHYHAIVYDIELDKSQFKRVGINEWGDPYYQSDEMDKFWRREHIDSNGCKWYSKIGNVTIAEVNWKTCNYVARYTVKKTTEQQDPNFHLAQGQINEYITMSKNIGLNYYQKNKEKIWLSDSVPIINKKTGQPVKPPSFFTRKLKEENEEEYNRITQKRKAQAETAEKQKDNLTDLTREERRKQKTYLNSTYVDWRKEL